MSNATAPDALFHADRRPPQDGLFWHYEKGRFAEFTSTHRLVARVGHRTDWHAVQNLRRVGTALLSWYVMTIEARANLENLHVAVQKQRFPLLHADGGSVNVYVYAFPRALISWLQGVNLADLHQQLAATYALLTVRESDDEAPAGRDTLLEEQIFTEVHSTYHEDIRRWQERLGLDFRKAVATVLREVRPPNFLAPKFVATDGGSDVAAVAADVVREGFWALPSTSYTRMNCPAWGLTRRDEMQLDGKSLAPRRRADPLQEPRWVNETDPGKREEYFSDPLNRSEAEPEPFECLKYAEARRTCWPQWGTADAESGAQVEAPSASTAATGGDDDVRLVYFVTDGEFVKIGMSGDVERRLPSLQTGNPRRLRVLGSVRGGLSLERGLHAAFKHRRVRPDGEWYRLSIEEVGALIAAVAVP